VVLGCGTVQEETPVVAQILLLDLLSDVLVGDLQAQVSFARVACIRSATTSFILQLVFESQPSTLAFLFEFYLIALRTC